MTVPVNVVVYGSAGRMGQAIIALIEQRPEHLFIERIESEAGEPRLVGTCWEPQLADHFASNLSRILPEWGWKTEAPKKKTKGVIEGGGPCEFEIQLRAIPSPALEPRLSAAKGDGKAKP